MLYHSIAPGTAVNLRRKRGEHHETGIPADGDLQPPYACKGLQNYRLAAATAPVRRICGRAGYRWTANRNCRCANCCTGHRTAAALRSCRASTLRSCGFLTGSWSNWQQKKAGRCKSCKKLKFPSCILADSCYNSKAIVSKAARRGSRY